MFTVKIGEDEIQVAERTTYEQLIEPYQEKDGNLITVVSSDGKIRELFKRVNKPCEIKFFTLKDDVGFKTYVRTATMLFMKAVFDVFGCQAAARCRMDSQLDMDTIYRRREPSPSARTVLQSCGRECRSW